MPTYDYACRACGHRFEHFESFSEPRLKRCPECGKDRLERLIGPGAGILFKGSGFYETDYKRAAPAGRDKDGAGKTEAKPDAKPEAAKADAPKPSAPAADKGGQAPRPSGGSAPKDSRPA